MNEVSKLRTIFFRNGYTEAFFNKVYSAFEHKEVKQLEVDGTKEDGEFKYIIKIPYVGSLSHEFKNKLVKLFFNDLSINITPVLTTFKVANYFSLKSRTPKLITSNVVYKFTCLCDANLTYIGKTKRHLMVRGLEHLEFEKAKPESEIKVHLRGCEICQRGNFDNFEIIKKCKSDQETKINEALVIKTENPKLNKNLFNKGSLYTLKVYY